MNPSIELNNNDADPETLNVSQTLMPEVDRQETLTPQQLYQQSMKHIWDKVSRLPEGQDKVVMSQIWEFCKKPAMPTAKAFPALVIHGFLVEYLLEDQPLWEAYSPYLKDFWRIGIQISSAEGYTLQPLRTFQANLQAKIYHMSF